MLENKENIGELTGLLGSVGNDFYGDLYADLLQKENIVPLFEKYDDIITGLCCVFCHNRDRGHITDLGASTLISIEFVQRIWEEIKNVKLIYTELFILKHRKNIVYLLAESSLNDDKIFGFNLPSSYFIETYFQDILNLIEYADVLFANAAEAILFSSLLGLVRIKNLDFLRMSLKN
jgi:sugar/nucleoside kinase (ribokinase family)